MNIGEQTTRDDRVIVRRLGGAASITAVAWGSALWATLVPTAAWSIGAVLLACAPLALGLLHTRPACAVVAIACVLGSGISFMVAAAEPARQWGSTTLLAADDAHAARITVTITGKASRWGAELAFDAFVSTLHAPPSDVERGDIAMHAPVRLIAPAGTALAPGSVVTLDVHAEAADPGRREVALLTTDAPVTARPPAGVLAIAADLRDSLLRRASNLPGMGATLLPGLAVGDTSLVTTELDGAMKATSLAHLTAVSGANCAIVVVAAAMVAARCGAGRRARVVVGAVCLAGFVVLVTPEPSVVRAAVMAAAAMAGVLMGRPGGGIGVLTLAIAVILLVDPWIVHQLGFALSAASTAAIVVLTPPLTHAMSRWIPPWLALVVAVPFAAQLACAPLIALITDQVSLVAVLANVIAAPAAPLATVGGLLCCLAAPVPLLADALSWLALLPSSWIAATATTLEAFPGASVRLLQGPVGALLLVIAGALIIAVALGGPRLRKMAAILLAVAVGVVTGWGPVSTGWQRVNDPSEWSIAVCDVGQGDAIVLRSEGEVALIDTGPDPEPLSACLDRLGVGQIDLLVLSHFDLDHTGGTSAVAGRVDVVLHGPPDEDAEAALGPLRRGGAALREVSRGDVGVLGAARWQILWPDAGWLAPGNDASVVLSIDGGGVPRTLLLGDLTEGTQRLLDTDGPYDVVKVAHHGSADQDPALYRETDATVALVCVGENSYGHPRDEILAVLRAQGTAIARSDTDGLILIGAAGDTLTLWRERGHE